jgi:hypothetical protein
LLAFLVDPKNKGSAGDLVGLGYRLGEKLVVSIIVDVVVFIGGNWINNCIVSMLAVLACLICLSNYFCDCHMLPVTVALVI